MRKMKKVLSVFIVLLMSFQLLACGKTVGDAPITSKWKVTELNVNGKVTSLTGAWAVYDKINGTKVPEFESDGTNFTFSMSGKTHPGTVVKNGDVYELYWTNPNSNSPTMSTATISGDTMVIELKDNIQVTFKAK